MLKMLDDDFRTVETYLKEKAGKMTHLVDEGFQID